MVNKFDPYYLVKLPHNLFLKNNIIVYAKAQNNSQYVLTKGKTNIELDL